jgi:hypothetical protein
MAVHENVDDIKRTRRAAARWSRYNSLDIRKITYYKT